MHDDARHATRMVYREIIAIEKAALIGDARGARKGRDVEKLANP